MGLLYHPRPGEILICDYPEGMVEPEMVKPRPVVCVSPKQKRKSKLVTIVPLSSTQPRYIMPYHYEVSLSKPLPAPWDANPFWAIGDHPMTVGFSRLDLIRLSKDRSGKRQYYQHVLDKEDTEGIRKAVLHAIGLGKLIEDST